MNGAMNGPQVTRPPSHLRLAIVRRTAFNKALLGKPAVAPRAAPGDLPRFLTNRRSTNAARGPGRTAEMAGTQQLLAGHP